MKRYLFPSILCDLLFVLVGQSRGWAQSSNAALVVNRPFPQYVTYAAGALRPTNFTQVQQDDYVRAFYDYWKQNYLVAAGMNGAGKAMYQVAFGAGSSVTVSEKENEALAQAGGARSSLATPASAKRRTCKRWP